MKLDINTLKAAVTSHAAAFRCVTDLQPAGGTGDKVFPATYEGGKYATEKRRIPKETELVDCVLLDSVQSQANRMEIALLEAWRRKEIPLPVITVDFSGNDLEKEMRITSLEAPHRIADALLRDSFSGGKPFRESDTGKRLDHVDNRNATALFELCPTALIFGMWDSTGPKGGLGAKFARALVSEMIGLHAAIGVKTSSRIDPAAIKLQAGPLYKAKGGGWTLDPKAAVEEKGKPVKLGKDGRPSESNHGNVTPSQGDGGVTISKAVQTTVLSLPALRRLSFPVNGSATDLEKQAKLDDSARTVLAALALCAATLVRENCDLRSRCQLFPTTEFVWEILDKPGGESKTFSLTSEEAIDLYKKAVVEAKAEGLPWLDKELPLKPSPGLVELVRRSQQLATQTAGETVGE
jgi:CRISPR-associated protein Csb1